jgi:16S rRNA (uracil1498-N3)-methyltransferase
MNQLFYAPRVEGHLVVFDEDESKHLATVLRRKVGDTLYITDGKGHIFTTQLAELGKRQAVARVLSTEAQPARRAALHLAVAPTKHMDRYEWMLEKVVEMGVETITPLRCQRSERDVVRLDRLEKIVVSAMKQSLRAYLPEIRPLTAVKELILHKPLDMTLCMAWCSDEPLPHLADTLTAGQSALILIGPEGDFSPEEVALARNSGALDVSLGTARLRTETAGLFATTVFSMLNR